jgi:hypothetical protein
VSTRAHGERRPCGTERTSTAPIDCMAILMG